MCGSVEEVKRFELIEIFGLLNFEFFFLFFFFLFVIPLSLGSLVQFLSRKAITEIIGNFLYFKFVAGF